MTQNLAELIMQKVWGNRDNPFFLLASDGINLPRDQGSTPVSGRHSRKLLEGLDALSYDFVDLMHDRGYGLPSNVETVDEDVKIAA